MPEGALAVEESGALGQELARGDGQVGTQAITCTPYVTAPTRNGGTIQATHWISCSQPVQSIKVTGRIENINGDPYAHQSHFCFNATYCSVSTSITYVGGRSYFTETYGEISPFVFTGTAYNQAYIP